MTGPLQIYLDYSATTPIRPEAIAAMQAIWTSQWGNPSSLHIWGQRAALAMEQARFQVAQLIHATPEAIVFTAGGTEADNLAIWGVTQAYAKPQHLIISSVEHSAIEEPARLLEQRGWQVTRLPVDASGRVAPESLVKALRPNTVLLSVIYGQSEVGTLQPIEALGTIARDAGVLFHTDAVQVAGRLPLDVSRLPVDLLSLSSHKLYGPQGAGALYVRPGVGLTPLLAGGGQEMGMRSGTPAVAVLAGFGVAAVWAARELELESLRLTSLRDRLFDLLAPCPGLVPTGDRQHRLPHHVSFAVQRTGAGAAIGAAIEAPPISGRAIVQQLNLAGIGISSGSACNSGKTIPSRVLRAMGHSDALALGAIRFTLGKSTALEDIEWTAMAVRQVLERMGVCGSDQNRCPENRMCGV
jgi:cysteine desulfurase